MQIRFLRIMKKNNIRVRFTVLPDSGILLQKKANANGQQSKFYD